MKLVLTTHQFLPEYSSGTELIVYNTAKELQRRGHDVTIVTAAPHDTNKPLPQRADHYLFDNLPVHRYWHTYEIADGQHNIFQSEYNYRSFYRWFRNFLFHHKPDLVHFIHLSRLSASAIDAAVANNIPRLFTATDFWAICPFSQLRLPDGSMCPGPKPGATNCIRHLMDVFQPPAEAEKLRQKSDLSLRLRVQLTRWGRYKEDPFAQYWRIIADRPLFIRERLQQLDRIIVPSTTMQKLMIDNGAPAEKVVKLPYGVRSEQIERSTNKGTHPTLRILFIGQIFEHKGCHLLIDAVRSLPLELNLRLRLYGDLTQDPAYVATLRTRAANDPRIELMGRFPNTDVSNILKDADLLVVPSLWYENTPLVIYEAMAAGVPVIASDLAGTAEAIKPETNGLLFQTGNTQDLAKQLRRLAEDRALVARLAEKTERPLTIAENVTALEKIYNEILARSESRLQATFGGGVK
ncbi:MAG: glycosyltransferase family 4 protein [Phycisphaerae bacterium]